MSVPNMTSNMQGCRVKKTVHSDRIHLASWNIGSLTGRLTELVEVMKRRNTNILCLQKTKWVGEKARIIAPWGYEHWYSCRDKNRNGVGITIDRKFIDDAVEVRR
jgi:exonuclease III